MHCVPLCIVTRCKLRPLKWSRAWNDSLAHSGSRCRQRHHRRRPACHRHPMHSVEMRRVGVAWIFRPPCQNRKSHVEFSIGDRQGRLLGPWFSQYKRSILLLFVYLFVTYFIWFVSYLFVLKRLFFLLSAYVNRSVGR